MSGRAIRWRSLGVGAALVVASLLLVIMWFGARPSVRDTDPAAPLAIAPLAEAREPVADLSRAGAPPAERSEVETTTSDAERGARMEGILGTVWLRGRVRSATVAVQEVRIEVRATWRVRSPSDGLEGGQFDLEEFAHGRVSQYRVLYANPDASGEFELDITETIVDRERLATELLVVAKHARAQTVSKSLAIEFPRSRLQRKEQIVLEVELDLRRDLYLLQGQAWTRDGELAEIAIAAFDPAGDRIRELPDGTTFVRHDRWFALELRTTDEFVLVAVAQGYRPCTARVTVGLDGTIAVPPLVLERGHSITGQVTSAASELSASASVAAVLEDPAELVRFEGHTLAWCRDAFEWASRRASVARDGTFELTGLGLRTYRVSLDAAARVYGAEGAARHVVAPRSGVELSLGLSCEVRLSFFRDGVALSNASFLVKQDRGARGQTAGGHLTDAAGRATLWITPDSRVEVTAPGPERHTHTFTVDSNAGGTVVEQRIDL